MKAILKCLIYCLLPLVYFYVQANFNTVRAQGTNREKAWVVDYEVVFDLPKRDAHELTYEDKQMIAMMELGKAMSGADQGKSVLKAYVTPTHIRVEQGGLLSTIQVSNIMDSTSFLLDSASKVAYRSPLASPKISSDMVGDSLVVISSADREWYFSDDTLTIAGHLCKKAVMRISAGYEAQDMIIWYAENMPKLFWGEYDYLEDIPGLAMRIATVQHGMEIGVQVRDIHEESVDAALFEVPADYTVYGNEYTGFGEVNDDAVTYVDSVAADDFDLAEGLHWTDNGELWGIEDDAGKVLIEPRYHDRFGYRFGLAPVSRDGKFGIINKEGKELIPLQYENAFVASEDRIWVMKDGLYALIDTTGKEILPAIYVAGSTFSDGLAYAQKGEKYGFIDKQGKIVIPFIYDDVDGFLDGSAWVKQGKEDFYIDKNNKRLD